MPNMPIQSPPAKIPNQQRRDAFEAELENLGGDITFSLLTVVCLNHLMDLCQNLNLG